MHMCMEEIMTIEEMRTRESNYQRMMDDLEAGRPSSVPLPSDWGIWY